MVRLKRDNLDKTLHSRCSIEIISFHPREWPRDPRVVTGVILLSLSQGVATKHKDRSFLPKMNHVHLSGPDSIKLDGSQPTAAFPVPGEPDYNKF